MSDLGYKVIVGLEIHAELATATKLFCGCSTTFGAPPNSQVCPICLAWPGALGVMNQRAVEYAVKAGLAVGCTITPHSTFARKQYFYPDLPKAYQVSQLHLPLCRDGQVEFALDGEAYRVRINRVHLEEEAGKAVHSGDSLRGSEFSLMDFNRGGIPLIEIVTEPNLRSGEAARAFLERLRTILRYIEVSDCKMQEGSLRCDANVNIHIQTDNGVLRTPIVEIKNLNSFRAVERAIAYESRRQYEEYLDGSFQSGLPQGKVTAGWIDAEGRTYIQREKGAAEDYRYFPDPDVPPVEVSAEQVVRWHAELPELPAAREQRFETEYGLPAYDAGVLTDTRAVADFFEETVRQFGEPKMVSNWIMGELLRLLKESGEDMEQALAAAPVTPTGLTELLELVRSDRINANTGKEVLEAMYRTGRTALEIVRERGLEQISDTDALKRIALEVIDSNPKVVADIKGGKVSAAGFLVGQVMKRTKGKANPKLVGELIRKYLELS